MAWRRHPPSPGLPEQLARFVPSEWPGCAHEALRAWQEACADWLAGDSEREPRAAGDDEFQRWWLAGGTRRALPFGEYGDVICLLREGERIARQMTPCPDKYRPAVHWTDGPPR